MAGVYLVHPLSPAMDVQTGLVYSQMGSKFSDTGVDARITLDYIEIPVPLRFSLADAKSDMRPHIYAGPAFAYRMSCSGSATSGGVTVTGDCRSLGESSSSNGGDEPTKHDVGAIVGGGLSFNTGGRAP